jgi:hypothetical protein
LGAAVVIFVAGVLCGHVTSGTRPGLHLRLISQVSKFIDARRCCLGA